MDKLQEIIQDQETFDPSEPTISIADARNVAIQYVLLLAKELVDVSNADITLQEGHSGCEYYIVNNNQAAENETVAFTKIQIQSIIEEFD